MGKFHYFCFVFIFCAFSANAKEEEGFKLSDQLEIQKLGSFKFDEDLKETGSYEWADHRLIAGYKFVFDNLSLDFEGDFLNGKIYGDNLEIGLKRGNDTWRDYRDRNLALGKVKSRKALMTYNAGTWQLLLGQHTFHWGLGMLANDGKSDRNDFGRSRQGNMVLRLGLIYLPFIADATASDDLRGLALLASLDMILRDDNASFYDDDRAYGAVLGFLIQQKDYKLGMIGSFRKQEDREDTNYLGETKKTNTEVGITNLYWKWTLDRMDDGDSLELETESAFIFGETNRSWLDETWEDGSKIKAFGSVLRLLFKNPSNSLELKSELGYASGDNDQNDDQYRIFTFNSDYNVGMVLYDHFLPYLTANAVDKVHNPSLIARFPAGTRYLVNQGVIRNSFYFYNVFHYDFNDWLSTKAAYLYARSAADTTDVFHSNINGGYNYGFDGKPVSSKELGHEIDIAVNCSFKNLIADTDLNFGIEYGTLFPGEAFSGLNQYKVDLLRAYTLIRY